MSGTAIADALRDLGHPVDADAHRPRRPLVAAARPTTGATTGRPPPTTTRRRSAPTGPSTVGAAIDELAGRSPAPVVVIALHGPFGEDGTVQALLEAADLAYTGSGVTASAIGMDKAIFKRLCRGIGLPVVDWLEVTAARWAAAPDDVRGELDRVRSGQPATGG